MFVRSEESSHSSLVVADGTTFVLSASHVSRHPNLITNLRPRTTAALLVAAGRPPAVPPRLSDAGAFGHVNETEGLVNLHARDEEGRVAGYSVPFLSRIFDALDSDIPTPPPTVQWHRPADDVGVHRCSCSGRAPQPDRTTAVHDHQQIRARDFRHLITAPVPNFLISMEIFFVVLDLEDIIVHPNATLVLDGSVAFMLARNFLCYDGARIVQQSPYLCTDIVGTLRGSINPRFKDRVSEVVAGVLKLNMAGLLHDVPTKP